MKCRDCKRTFDKPTKVFANTTPGWSNEPTFWNSSDECPYCGSTDFEGLMFCDYCCEEFGKSELFLDKEGKYACAECNKENKRYADV